MECQLLSQTEKGVGLTENGSLRPGSSMGGRGQGAQAGSRWVLRDGVSAVADPSSREGLGRVGSEGDSTALEVAHGPQVARRGM